MTMCNRQKGLSLIEMLVGMTLLFITLSLLFAASYQIRKQQKAGETLAQHTDDYRLVMRFVSKLIEQAGPVTLLNGKQNQVLFDGQAEALSFVSFLPSHAGGAGLYQVQLVKQQNQLMLYYRPLTDLDNTQSNPPQQMVLLSDIDGLELVYLSAHHGWQPSWQRQLSLPKKVRLTIKQLHHSDWPTLTVAIAAEVVPLRSHLSVRSHGL